MKLIILTTFLLGTLFSCKKKDGGNVTQSVIQNKIEMNNDSLKIFLEKQIQNGFSIKEKGLDAVSEYQYGMEDYKIASEISQRILQKNGFKFLSEEDFNQKIFQVFKFKNNENPINFLIEFPCSKNPYVYQIDGNYVISNNNPVFIDKKKHLLTESYFIPELIDYEKEYPVIYENEKNIEKSKEMLAGNTVEIIKWSDLENLNETRQKNIEKIIHRNKYLFNDNRASFAWLQFNDKLFLESLVKTFGYVDDENLLNFVIKNNYKNQDEFYKILWNERCNGTIVFNKEVMDLISESTDDKKELYLNAISDYLVKEVRNEESVLSNNFSKKAEILGKLAYYSSKIGEPLGKYYQFFSILNGNEDIYGKEFEKNNYYNISDFKIIWEETRTGGISLPGME